MCVQSLGGEDPLEGRAWQSAPIFLPGKSHGQRSRVGSIPQGREEADTTGAALRARIGHGM